MIMNHKEVSELVVGDEVAVSAGGWGVMPTISTVERITKTQIILADGNRFNRNSGRLIGASRFHGRWLMHGPEAKQEIARLKAEQKRGELIRKLRDFEWGKLPFEKLQKILGEIS